MYNRLRDLTQTCCERDGVLQLNLKRKTKRINTGKKKNTRECAVMGKTMWCAKKIYFYHPDVDYHDSLACLEVCDSSYTTEICLRRPGRLNLNRMRKLDVEVWK